MPVAPERDGELARFPRPLRDLVLAELAAGNEVLEISHGFPAAPCGASVHLARPVSTCPRASTPEIHFYERNGSQYSGEFTTRERHFFVLEPARPYEAVAPPRAPRVALGERRGSSVVDRFRASMEIDYERWREGIGYDLALLPDATPQERGEIADMLLARGISDWRDVEAIAALDTPRAREALLATLRSGDTEHAQAVVRFAPQLVGDAERTAILVRALESLEFYGGLTQALLDAEEHHPPDVVDALLHGVLHREGSVAFHFAALLLALRGAIPSRWDMSARPYLFRFTTADPEARRAAFRDLCARIRVDPDPYL